MVWIGAAVISVLPLTRSMFFGQHYYGTNGMCLPLHIHDPFAQVNQFFIIFCIKFIEFENWDRYTQKTKHSIDWLIICNLFKKHNSYEGLRA